MKPAFLQSEVILLVQSINIRNKAEKYRFYRQILKDILEYLQVHSCIILFGMNCPKNAAKNVKKNTQTFLQVFKNKLFKTCSYKFNHENEIYGLSAVTKEIIQGKFRIY